jgi:hypothetical protein
MTIRILLLLIAILFISFAAVPLMAQNTGACCEYMGSWYCSVTTQELCESWGAIYAGDGTECYDGLCESLPGACCYGDDECAYISESECEEYNGEFKGAGTDCYDDPEDEDEIAEICEEPVYGACCSENPGTGNIVCFEVTKDECADLEGTYLGDNTYCIDIDGNDNDISDICEDVPGACCLGNSSCSVMNALDCQLAGGEFNGAGTDCYDDPEDEDDIAEVCEEIQNTGACCEYMGSWYCSVTTQELCESWGAIYAGDGTECYDGLCESLPGACCYGDGECAYVSQSECENDPYNGDFKGIDTDCYDDPEDDDEIAEVCEEEPAGACCWDNGEDCRIMTETECLDEYGGEWKGEGADCGDYDEETELWSGCSEQIYDYLPGDANMINGQWPPTIIGGDVTYLVGYFRGINGPCLVGGLYNSADANGDCSIIGSDVTRLVSYFRGIAHCADYPPAWPPLPDEMPSGWPNCEDVPGNE